MPLKNVFNAKVIYQLHSNPAILGLYSEELGYTEIPLRDLNLTADEIDALHKAENVSGTYEMRQKPAEIYVMNKAMKDPRKGLQKSVWKVKTIEPA